jgi:hypothetical protein
LEERGKSRNYYWKTTETGGNRFWNIIAIIGNNIYWKN